MRIDGHIIIEENSVRILSMFNFELTDFKIKLPSILLAKVADSIKLVLDFYMKKVK